MRRIVVLYLASLDQWITSPFLVFFHICSIVWVWWHCYCM